MKEITIRVPDQKVNFVLELIEQLGLEVSGEVADIPEEHKAIVRERMRKSEENPERLLDWEEARKQFTYKEKA